MCIVHGRVSSSSIPLIAHGDGVFVNRFIVDRFLSQGVPLASVLVPLSGLIAFFGALSILLGYRARLGAWLIAIFLIGVTPMHKFWGIPDPMMQQMQMVMFMKNLAMLGSALLISPFGSGSWSLDAHK